MADNPAIALLLTHVSARAAELSLPCSLVEALHPGALVGHDAVLIGGLGNDSGQAEAWQRAAEERAASALSGLPDKAREGLHLFLVGPPGASEDLRWRELAAQIERDGRVCPKWVWLPASSNMESSVQTFLDRTFLSRPWRGLEGIPPPRLDPVADFVRALAGREELRDTPLPALHSWAELLTQPGDAPDLVEPLMRALKELKQ
jgi:hypothetical protein